MRITFKESMEEVTGGPTEKVTTTGSSGEAQGEEQRPRFHRKVNEYQVTRRTCSNSSTTLRSSMLSVQGGVQTQKGTRAEDTDHGDSARGQTE